MADYEINVPGSLLSRLMTEQNGIASLLEAILNQVLDLRRALRGEQGKGYPGQV